MARKILLADDSVTAQNMGRKILADAGYEVIAVNNGSAALKKIAEVKPDLVVLDVYMPGYSGLEVCQRLKESHETARIPVLLTVGKLEPFKPEEAQRVRAEGYIVKPFEASELLSALSKLEDKVVPRAEPSKPGRFARAMAAAEESSRASRKETTGDPNGWSSRIRLPHDKTEPEEKVADDSAIYNPFNRDLRTVVETAAEKAAEKVETQAPPAKANEAILDVAALAPAGVPKDVTPEEVAAIAAAAAKIQAASAAVQYEHQAENRFDENQASETKVSDTSASQHQVSEALVAETGISEAAYPRSFEPALARGNDETARPVRDDVEVKAGTLQEDKVDAVAGEAGAAPEAGFNGEVRAEETPDVPVTMAAATAESVGEASAASRWTAVPVALEGDEATVSLEQEMQRAYAAYADHMAVEADFSNLAPVQAAEKPVQADSSSTDVVPVVETAALESSSSSHVAALDTDAVTPAVPEFADPNPAFAPVTESVASAAETGGSDSANLVAPQAREEQPGEAQPCPESVTAEAETAPSADIARLIHEHAPESQPDSETVKSTAAAWANWRQIRDTRSDSEVVELQAKEFEVPEPAPAEPAAMAVAAGAEQILQEASAAPQGEPADVASIVESVLANLRPKLMEEISRKMAEKK